MRVNLLFSSLVLCFLLTVSSAARERPRAGEQCGWQADNKTCANNLCCSAYGFCGSTDAYCGNGCQSQCDGGGGGGGSGCSGADTGGYLADILSRDMFEEFLLHRNDAACPAKNFYCYEDFIAAAKLYPDFANTGDDETRKREVAAFFGQTSHETTGGWPTAPGGPYAWGYCFNAEVGGEGFPGGTFCDPSWPCNTSFAYYGRGPIQLTWNYNYYQCQQDINIDLINNPNIIIQNGTISFDTALWFWMKPQSPKPSCHDVMTGEWVPTQNDINKGRLPGYGVCTNIINGGLECGNGGPDARVEDRIGFYKRYCDLLGVDYGDNLDCYNQRPFTDGMLVQSM